MAKRRGSSEQGSKKMGCLLTLVFGVGFSAAGITAFIFLTVKPLYGVYRAQEWDPVTCTILRSKVETHRDSDGDTYSIQISYRYTYKGQQYNSERYRFSPGGSSSGYAGKKEVVDAHPPGSQHTCYVNPEQPDEAVIERDLSWAHLWGLFPLPFMAVGFGFLYAGLTGKLNNIGSSSASNWRPGKGKKPNQPDDAYATSPFMPDNDDTGWVTLDPSKSRRNTFIGLTIFGLIWNIVIWVIAYDNVIAFVTGRGFSFELGFMSIFLLIGLGVAIAAVRALMVVFAPAVILELSRRAIPLGGSAEIRWHIAGRRGRVDAVEIKLVGEEKATYRRGADTVTDTETFMEQVLLGEDPERSGLAHMPMMHEKGELVLTIPLDAMHSFAANNNEIVWRLEVKAHVPNWPDPKDKYDLTVLPLSIEGDA